MYKVFNSLCCDRIVKFVPCDALLLRTYHNANCTFLKQINYSHHACMIMLTLFTFFDVLCGKQPLVGIYHFVLATSFFMFYVVFGYMLCFYNVLVRYFFFVVEQVYVIFLYATTFDDFLWFCSQSIEHHMLLTTLQELLTVHIAWCTMYNVFNTLYCWYVLFGLYDLLLLRSFSCCPRTIYKHKLSRTTRSHHFLFTNHVFTRCYEYSSYLSRSTLQYIISSKKLDFRAHRFLWRCVMFMIL